MRYPEFHYRWTWRLAADPAALWPWVADTNRFNRDTDLPPLRQPDPASVAAAPLANARRRLHFFRLGTRVAWEEEPFEWIRPYRFGVFRRYTQGPVAEMRVQAELAPRAEGGTEMVYQVWARPANLLGLLAIPIQIGWLSAAGFARVVHRYDRLAVQGQLPRHDPAARPLAPGGRVRLAAATATLLAQAAAPDLVSRLAALIEEADDLTLARLRPYTLADYWGAARRPVLELCLKATRAGLLEFQWELLCPLCRGSQQPKAGLGDVAAQVHCDSCRIDYEVNFDHSVELTFRPNPAIRAVESRQFCIGGPQVTPHIVVQQLMPPLAGRSLTVLLEAGRYRVRTLALRGGQPLQVADDGMAAATLRAGDAGWPEQELQLRPDVTLELENRTATEQLFIVERTAWSDQAATAAEVTALQMFRDLFARESLRPGERIVVGSLTVVFTDLRGSTDLYRELGDASAFGVVMDHFDVLKAVIAGEEGAIVKSIGDAVMAVFCRPVCAVRALLAAQQALTSPPAGRQPLRLKAGIHYGSCIAVTLNDRLDYFGSTINVAARLAGLSGGDDLILSDAVYRDPEVARFLAAADDSVAVAALEARLKGFGRAPFSLWRVQRRSRVARR
jgi:class 3 adenylate cyclase